MLERMLSGRTVPAVGLGCMNYAMGYLPVLDDNAAGALLRQAVELGYVHFDTADVYGKGRSEELIGQYLTGPNGSARGDQLFIASKCGFGWRDASGQRRIDNTPENLRITCEDSLRRLGVETIDLYYLHRWDCSTPIEDVIGTLSRFVEEGKVRTIGMSEVSARTIRAAHAVHPIAAVQSEYSLWTRNPELGVLDACRDIGAAFVAFSPLGRGFLADGVAADETFLDGDLRVPMPRFQGQAWSQNRRLLDPLRRIAAAHELTPAELAMAWVLAQGDHVHVIPGTRSTAHLAENFNAGRAALSAETLAELDSLINQTTVVGDRYSAPMYNGIDTERFAD